MSYPTTTDSYTRNEQWVSAQRGIEESQKAGRSMLNGFPMVNYGVSGTRKLVEAIDKPAIVLSGTCVSEAHRGNRICGWVQRLSRLGACLYRVLHQGDFARRRHPQLSISRSAGGALCVEGHRVAPSAARLSHRNQYSAVDRHRRCISMRCWRPDRACEDTAWSSVRRCTSSRTPLRSRMCTSPGAGISRQGRLQGRLHVGHLAALDGSVAA